MAGIAKLAFRVVLGGLFIGHGTQKLFGWFGGGGLDGTEKMMDHLDLHPARQNAVLAGITEAGCGALLVAGAATPLAATGIVGTMATAIRTVHGKNGPWNSNRGWEFNAIIIASLALLVEGGPGKLSLDAAAGRARGGTGLALGVLAAGVAASTAIIELGHWFARRDAERNAARDAIASADSEPLRRS
ncbi:MAG: DoxX family protein [Terrimesophilobacter sp.]